MSAPTYSVKMAIIKVIAIINWLLFSVYGVFVLWALLQKTNPHNDAGGGDQEVAIKILGVFLLLVLVGLNLLSYSWTKITALILVILLLLLIRTIATN